MLTDKLNNRGGNTIKIIKELMDLVDYRIKIAFISILILIGGIFVYLYFEKAQLDEAIKDENKELINLQDIGSSYHNVKQDIMYEFIITHLPVKHDEVEISYLLWNRIEENNHGDTKITSKNEALSKTVSQLINSLRNEDVNLFIGLFEVYAYMDYLQQFDTIEEKEESFINVIKKLNRDGQLNTGTFIAPSNSKEPLKVYLEYNDGKSLELKLSYVAIVDEHSKENKYAYAITTDIGDLLKQIEK